MTRVHIIIIASVLAVAMLMANGCGLRSMVAVAVPKDVLEAVGHEGKPSMQDIDIIVSQWEDHVKSNTARLQDSVDRSEAVYAQLHSLMSIGINMAGDASSSIPYGGLLFGALTGVTGLFMPQPKIGKPKTPPKISTREA